MLLVVIWLCIAFCYIVEILLHLYELLTCSMRIYKKVHLSVMELISNLANRCYIGNANRSGIL